MSRRAAARRLHTDGAWRAACGLTWSDRALDESELRRFERFLRRRDPETGARWHFVWLGCVVDACLAHGVVGPDQVWVADSTPMLCYGAVVDTIRFLGDEARSLTGYWSKLTGTSVAALAETWGLSLLTAKSTKGHFRDTDWSDADERAVAVDEVASTALQVASHIRRSLHDVASAGKRKRVARRCRNLMRKLRQDLEPDEQGRLTVARRVVEDRLVSRTDPEARHARKSRKKCFNGFKLHVIGEAISGLITAVCVTPANTHDGAVAHRLISRAKNLYRDLQQVLGDTHYGAARLRKVVRETLEVDLLGKPQALRKRTDDRLRKSDFEFDLQAMTATCPAGTTTDEWMWSWASAENMHAPRFSWPKTRCASCPMAERCTGQRGRKTLRLHPYEQELQNLRRRWATPEGQDAYRRRSQGERLIFTMTRHGCRKARAWGLQAAQAQAHAVAIAANLKLLARVVADTEGDV